MPVVAAIAAVVAGGCGNEVIVLCEDVGVDLAGDAGVAVVRVAPGDVVHPCPRLVARSEQFARAWDVAAGCVLLFVVVICYSNNIACVSNNNTIQYNI